MSINFAEIQSSELSRNSSAVFAEAEKKPVRVTRRDGEDFVLMSYAEAEARQSLLEFAAQLIAVTTDNRGTLVERMCDRFPWMYSLSDAEKELCTKEIINAARASFATEQPNIAVIEINSWHETSLAKAAQFDNESFSILDKPRRISRP